MGIDFEIVAVANVLGVSANRQQFELIIVTRNRSRMVCDISASAGLGAPEIVGKGIGF